MNYYLVFETTSVLSINKIAQIFNAIDPTDVIGTQQGNCRLLCNLVFGREITKEEVNDLMAKADIDFATCITCNRVSAFQVFIKE